MQELNRPGFLRSLRFRYGMVLAGLLVIALYFLWEDYQAQIIAYLPPFLALGACLGMHFFMHRGHGHGKGNGSGDSDQRK